jgi:Fic family protein
LEDRAGRLFWYIYIDKIQESVHHIDSLARGTIGMPNQITNPQTRDRYLVRSLIEEAITSSQLEGASTTRQVAKEMIRTGRPPRTRDELMIHNNFETMQEILELKDEPLSPEFVFRIHRRVTEGTLDDPGAAGRLRRGDERVVVADAYGEDLHVPLDASALAERMEAMCRFANGSSVEGFIHPVVRSMVLHFWLAYDHPFVDGNGRTARALFYWSMLRHGYWLFEFISISEIILKAPVKYGMAFLETETDHNDLTYFLLYHVEVIRKAIDRLHAYLDREAETVRALDLELRGMIVLNPRQRVLIAHALRHPGQTYTIESHRKDHGVSYQTARTDLLGLAEKKLLRARKRGKEWNFLPADRIRENLKEWK